MFNASTLPVSKTSRAWTPGRISWVWRISVLALLFIGAQVEVGPFQLAVYYLIQDRWTILLAVVLMMGVAALAQRGCGAGLLDRLAASERLPLLMLALAVLAAFAGTHLIFGATPVSYDEVQADFDARVFAAGKLAYPVPEAWRPFIAALGPLFFLRIPDGAAWISAYWPGNAALRALFDSTIGMAWCSPALLGVGLASTYGVARKLWPDRRDAAFIAVLLLGTSSQALVTAMTPYAMTAHLAVNMLWLRLFLQDRPLAHAGAMAVGVLGVGLHQVVFHPLFVAPFILMLLCQKRVRLAAFYMAGYGVALAAWSLYPVWLAWLQTPGAGPSDPIRALLVDRWADGAGQGRFGHGVAFGLTVLNLARLAAWLNPALILLFAVGAPLALAKGALPRAILASVLLTAAAATLALPYQGHGWGWRYSHGVLGSMALVGAMAWLNLTERPDRGEWSSIVAGASLGSLLLLFPLNALHAARFAAPIRDALALIQGAGTDLVVVDGDAVSFGEDLARNRPDLRNTPKILSLEKIPPAALPELCRRGSIAVFDAGAATRLGFIGANGPEPRSPMREAFDAQCKARIL
ncbi:hypothetical protein ABEG18_15350 [Alsobacter sp. KACC 23698]|uniref:DUF2029 domain-containing protein n=1 Tax=Alsobacter sp. KACC 23698 TaxID=3149229 RepID=A0AAU7J9S4_9HYPH